MKVKLLTFFFLCLATQGIAQLQNSWWFLGQGSGLKFTANGLQLMDSTAMGFDNGCTTVSDSLGNLLFYTNGCKLYNRLHQPMAGNDNLPCRLSGHGPGSTDSLTIGAFMTNGVLSFNVPGSDSKYYLFTYGTIGNWINQIDGIYYQVIDMNLNGGLGGVELPKNRVAYSYHHGTVADKYAAVRHANGRDWWLVAVSSFFNFQTSLDSVRIDRFLFTPSGIADTLTTLYPNVHDAGMGEISVSHDGSKIAFGGREHLYLTDFDRCMGTIGPLTSLDSVSYSVELGNLWFGVSFAPNRNDLLYGGTFVRLYQYQLDTLTNQTIARNTIAINNAYCSTSPAVTTCWYLGQLQQSSDGNIFQISGTQNYWDIPASDTMPKKLRYIDNPDSLYPVAQYKMTPPILNKPALAGLPNQVNWKLGRLIGSECDTLTSIPTALVEEEKLFAQLFPNPATTGATLVLSKPARESMELVLYDVLGTVSLRVAVPKNQKYVQLDLTSLSDGVYFYRLSGKQSLNGKLVKLQL